MHRAFGLTRNFSTFPQSFPTFPNLEIRLKQTAVFRLFLCRILYGTDLAPEMDLVRFARGIKPKFMIRMVRVAGVLEPHMEPSDYQVVRCVLRG